MEGICLWKISQSIVNIWVQNQSFLNVWIKKLWYPDTMEFYSATKKLKSCHFKDEDRTRGHNSKGNKLLTESQMPYDFSHKCNIRNKTSEHSGREKIQQDAYREGGKPYETQH